MSTIRLRRDASFTWTLTNRVLSDGEPGYEIDTGRLKIGDGVTPWSNLDYFLPDDLIRELIHEIVNSSGSGGSDQAHADLIAHINSLTPHPVYDDGPSFVLLYLNAKV